MPDPAPIKYRAFLSYSHTDAKWARRFHRRLENFRIDAGLADRDAAREPVPRTLRPIFRDRDDFGAGRPLDEQTRAALYASAALIVLCSPAAATSKYVNEEVRLFRWRHPERPVIPVILDGKPGYADRECFPPAVRFEVGPDGVVTERPSVVPLAADIREEGEDLAIAKVVGTLIGLSTDEVYRREQRAQKRRLRRWIAGLSAVALSLAVLAAWAEINRREAQRNFEVAAVVTNTMIYEVTNELRTLKGAKIDRIREIIDTARAALDRLQAPSLWERTKGWFRRLMDLLVPPARAQSTSLERSRAALLIQDAVTRAAEGDLDGMERRASEAIVILRRLVVAAPSDIELPRELSVALNKVGEARLGKGNAAGAAQAFGESLQLMERLLERFPQSPLLKRDVYVALTWQGNLALREAKLEEAQAKYTRARALIDEALAADLQALRIPDSAARAAGIDKTSLERERAVAINKLGDIAAAGGDNRQALQHYEQSLAIRRRLSNANPDDALLFRQVFVSLGNVGWAHYAVGDFERAGDAFAESVALVRGLLKSDPRNESHKRDLSVSLNQFGSARLQAGRIAEARAAFAEDLALTRELAGTDKGNAELRQELLTSLVRMAEISMLPLPDLAAACKLLTEVEQLQRQGVPTAADAVDVVMRVRQDLAAAGHQIGNCR